jgi:predicted ATPase
VLQAIDRRLTNAEIAQELFISVRTVESHIASLRRKLRVDSRAGLIATARRRRRPTIQVPQNSFVGRDEQLAALQALLATQRWVTVVGPAGCGKTRLALEAAVADARVPVVVELEHATGQTVGDAVAQAIGLTVDGSADVTAACAVALDAEPHLLVLDNCDRVAAPAAGLVQGLMARARSLAVLATSRSPLGGTDETVFALDPLPVAGDTTTAAVRLFLDRAGSAAPGLDLAGDDVDLVARICERLDGLPLAIELAAARVRHLPVAELATRLDDGLRLLGRPGPASRHRTLEAAFAWTWDLLDDDERSVLAQLAALPRTFDLDLADAVAGPGAAAVVLGLLDRSLVSPTVGASRPARYRLLDSVRSFVLGRTDRAVVDAARLAHAEVHAARVGDLAARIRTDDSRALAQGARRLALDVAAAIDWASAERPALAVALGRSLAIILEQIGPDPESLAALARAARTPAVRASVTAIDLCDIGKAVCYSDVELVDDLAVLAIEIATDTRSRLAAQHLTGWADAYQDRATSALGHLEVAEQLATECDDVWQLACIRQARGVVMRREMVDPPGALAVLESAAETYALAGDAMHVNNCRYMMAAVAAASGERVDEALVWIDECAAYARATGNRVEVAHAVLTQARLRPSPDNDALLLDAIDAFRAGGDLRCLTRSYLVLAGRPSRSDGIALLEAALAVATEANDQPNQVTVLARLIAACWDSGGERQAARALGALITLLGRDDAVGRCPPAMVDALPRWRTAIADGQANGYTPGESSEH